MFLLGSGYFVLRIRLEGFVSFSLKVENHFTIHSEWRIIALLLHIYFLSLLSETRQLPAFFFFSVNFCLSKEEQGEDTNNNSHIQCTAHIYSHTRRSQQHLYGLSLSRRTTTGEDTTLGSAFSLMICDSFDINFASHCRRCFSAAIQEHFCRWTHMLRIMGIAFESHYFRTTLLL